MSNQLKTWTTSDTTRTLKTIHIVHSYIHSKGGYEKDDYDGGDLVDLNFPHICLIGEEKPR